jgi:acetate kinase
MARAFVAGYVCLQSVGKMMVALSQLDALIFTGGIRKISASMYAQIMQHLQCFGLSLDEAANSTHGNTGDSDIQAAQFRASQPSRSD